MEGFEMASTERKLPVQRDEDTGKTPRRMDPWQALENLRRQVDHLFEDSSLAKLRRPFARSSFDVEPFWRRELLGRGMPAVDITEKAKSFELTAELPGMEEKDIEIKLSDGNLLIRGEKLDEVEEQKKDYYLSERHYGSFERIFNLPKGIDSERIEARFSKGVLTVSLPKKPEAVKPETVIQIKTG
jgi:HSP20 family protein